MTSARLSFPYQLGRRCGSREPRGPQGDDELARHTAHLSAAGAAAPRARRYLMTGSAATTCGSRPSGRSGSSSVKNTAATQRRRAWNATEHKQRAHAVRAAAEREAVDDDRLHVVAHRRRRGAGCGVARRRLERGGAGCGDHAELPQLAKDGVQQVSVELFGACNRLPDACTCAPIAPIGASQRRTSDGSNEAVATSWLLPEPDNGSTTRRKVQPWRCYSPTEPASSGAKAASGEGGAACTARRSTRFGT
ncbi:hypothetical protein U9M48_028990 [Paspalum notatum var. saurae]|uniref:Uncharacterized protein n=1 Tax=Paspalum notatum var. saurae TaxID=547442 RepID=A0AAQ3X1K4_PASNO